MSSILYPLHFQRRFERRWASRMVSDGPRRSPSQGTSTCTCGHLIIAPVSSTYLPAGVVNKWRCSACGNDWETIADPGVGSTKTAQ
ncbi:hypothetical protein [Bradyrhizobium sp. NAS80.1]|uniref:hypothetical protein n=1 Tax=Bradyrhizobium sp. NAS80.1 TaxID=1680159 RepID=UPI0009FCB035|nr:hypothetical protein [Bradyrhizobium sp. NAS80.1]